MAHLFRELEELSPNAFIETDNETVYSIKKQTGSLSFPTEFADTVSILPVGGPVKKMATHGFKWNLTTLNKNFSSLSNVALGKTTIRVESKGEVLVIINKGLKDEQIALTPKSTQS